MSLINRDPDPETDLNADPDSQHCTFFTAIHSIRAGIWICIEILGWFRIGKKRKGNRNTGESVPNYLFRTWMRLFKGPDPALEYTKSIYGSLIPITTLIVEMSRPWYQRRA
jgi:hypothetical protein